MSVLIFVYYTPIEF